MTRSTLLFTTILLSAITLSAIAVVDIKYVSRLTFERVQDLRAQRDAIDIEWNRLRLEEAALSTHVRIEKKAQQELNMFIPRTNEIFLIEMSNHEHPETPYSTQQYNKK